MLNNGNLLPIFIFVITLSGCSFLSVSEELSLYKSVCLKSDRDCLQNNFNKSEFIKPNISTLGNKKNPLDFVSVLNIYNKSIKSNDATVNELKKAVVILKKDTKDLEKLYNYSLNNRPLNGTSFRSNKLNYFFREIVYLQYMQIENNRQLKLIGKLSNDNDKDKDILINLRYDEAINLERINNVLKHILYAIKKEIRIETLLSIHFESFITEANIDNE